MNKYNHPLLQEVDYSQTAEPAMEMLLTLQQQKDSLDWNAYLAKPFETPLFEEVADIRLDEANERFKFVQTDGETWDTFSLADARTAWWGAPGFNAFIITMADSTSGLVGGYYLDRTVGFDLVFDRLLWEACGQPLDGRGFRMVSEGTRWRPVVMGMDETFLLGGYGLYEQMVPYFPDQQVAKTLAADFALKTSDPQECRLVSNVDLQMVEAVRQQPGWEEFSLVDWQQAQTDMKERLKSTPTATLLPLSGVLPLPTWGAMDAGRRELHLCVQIPGQGWQSSHVCSALSDPFNILSEYAQARPKSDFYRRCSKETVLTAIEIICTCLGISSKRKLKEVPYLVEEWGDASDVWFGGKMSRLAQIFVDHRLKPFRAMEMDSPNAHLLRDDEIGQWLPADFKITNQNKDGFRTFLIGVLYDLRDLTAEQAAECLQQCLCSQQAQQVEFEKMAGAIQLLDLMAGGYFDHGKCRLGWSSTSVIQTHAWRCYPARSPRYQWSSALLPFSWKEQVVLGGFAFCLPKSEAEYGKACLYCGLQQVEEMTLASGRIPPVIVSLAGSPRVPIGVVEPLSTDFELSEEFYQTLNEPKKQFDERFKKIVEQYWEVFDRKYPYMY